MARKQELLVGSAIVALGIALAAHRLAPFSLWRYLWPGLLILAGGWVLWRALRAAESGAMSFHLVGDIARRGPWQVHDEELYVLIGDIDLDLTVAQLPEGNVALTCIGLVGDVHLRAPGAVGVRLSAKALVGEAHFDAQRQKMLARSIALRSPNLGQAQHCITLRTCFLASDIHISRI